MGEFYSNLIALHHKSATLHINKPEISWMLQVHECPCFVEWHDDQRSWHPRSWSGIWTLNIMPLSHYRRYVPRLQVFLDGGTASQIVPFCSSSQLNTFGETLLSFQLWFQTCVQTCVTVVRCPCISTLHMSPYYTERQTNHNFMYAVDHSFGNHSKKLVSTCVQLPAHAHGTKFTERNFKHLKTSIGCER